MGRDGGTGGGLGYVAADRGLITWSWIIDVAAWVGVVLLFPDGRLPGHRWRPAIWASLAGAALLLAGQALDATRPPGSRAAATVLRYRQARSVERQQLK
jgi:hypothetical protein